MKEGPPISPEEMEQIEREYQEMWDNLNLGDDPEELEAQMDKYQNDPYGGAEERRGL